MNTAQFKIDSEWNDGLTATISLENNSDRRLDGWLFEFTAEFEITQVWNAELVSHEGDRYIFRHLNYNQTIAAGSNKSFGFQAAKSDGDSNQVQDFRFNGIDIQAGVPTVSSPTSPDPSTGSDNSATTDSSSNPSQDNHNHGNEDNHGSEHHHSGEHNHNEAPLDDDVNTEPLADGGQTFVSDGTTQRITNFDPTKDRVDIGTDSIHTQIPIDTPDGLVFQNMFNTSRSLTLVGINLKDLRVENFTPISDAHLQQDLSAALAWENGAGYVRNNTVYIRSHEEGLEEIVDFNSATDKISFFYLSVRGDNQLNFSVEQTSQGVRFFSPITDQSMTLRGIQFSDLNSSHFEWRANQLEDNVAGRMGLSDKIANFSIVDENVFSGKSIPMAGLVDRAPYHSNPDYTGTQIGGADPSGDPVDPTDPVNPVDPVDPVTPIEPVTPATPIETVAPTTPVDPVTPTAPTTPVDQTNTQAVFSVVNDWQSGFTGSMEITSAEAQPLNGWTIEFEAPFQITNIWNAEIISQQGDRYRIKNAHWNSDLAPNQSVSFGFNGQGAATEPNGYRFNGEAITLPSAPTSVDPPINPPTDLPTDQPIEPPADQGNPPTEPSPPDDSPQTGDFNYGEALQKSFLFYEAQRAGDLPADNRIDWRGDSTLNDGADVGLDLSGGYFDAGDHVKFVFPMAGSMTMLSWGLVEYRDAYATSGQLDEALDAIKWGTDFLLEAHQTSNGKTTAFAGQVGDGNVDHGYWGSPEAMNLTRPTALLTADAPGSDLAAEAAAALASASIVFRPTNSAYADELLDNAMQLYDFGDQYRGKYSDSIPNAQAFYNSWSGYEDELSWGAAWIHEALEAKGSTDTTYLNKAEQNYNGLGNGWTQSWDNKSYGAAILLAQETGDSRYKQDVEGWLNNWTNGGINTTNGGLAWLDQWGSLRYSANTAFLAGVYGDNVNDPGQKYSDFAEEQIDYILGDNPENFSYMVGFGNDFAQNPHHRGASGTTNINDSADNRHTLYGALVGGPSSANDFAYRDERTDYIANEVALDYNAGLTGALARQYGEFGGNPLSEIELNGLVGVTTDV